MMNLIVQAAVYLHNYVKNEEENLSEDLQQYLPHNFSELSDNNSETLLRQWRHEVNESIFQPLTENYEINDYSHIRDHFKLHFMGPGKVPWPDKAIEGGNM